MRLPLPCLCALALPLLLLQSLALARTKKPSKDYYDLLGVERHASKQQIKKAMRDLAIKHHPDKGGSVDIFSEISHAADTLLDDEKRRIYDQFGEEGLKKNQGAREAHHHDPFDVFSHFFGGFGAGHGPFQSGENRGPQVVLDLTVDLRDLYTGTLIEIDISKQVICESCRGTGAEKVDDVKPCAACGGRGLRIVKQMLGPGIFQQMQTTCDACGGRGKVVKSTCPTCQGRKVRRGSDRLTVVVEKGMRDEQRIEFGAEGDESPDHLPGDVIFVVREQAHPVFVRRGDNLYTKEAITLPEALTGFERRIKHLDGEEILVRRTNVTQPGFVQVLSNQGMPQHNDPLSKGKLFVEYTVVLPEFLDAEKQAALKALFS